MENIEERRRYRNEQVLKALRKKLKPAPKVKVIPQKPMPTGEPVVKKPKKKK